MSDSNPTRARAQKNRRAFQDVIGDPFDNADVEQGCYQRLKHRSLLSSKPNTGEGIGTVYPNRPNPVDFCVDVENVIEDVFDGDPALFDKFIRVYIRQEDDSISLAEQSYIEQTLGRKFLARGLSPSGKYFTVIQHRRRPDAI